MHSAGAKKAQAREGEVETTAIRDRLPSVVTTTVIGPRVWQLRNRMVCDHYSSTTSLRIQHEKFRICWGRSLPWN